MRHPERAFCHLPPHCRCLTRRMFPPSSPAPLILHLHALLTCFLHSQHELVTQPIILSWLSFLTALQAVGSSHSATIANTTRWALRPFSKNSGVSSTLESHGRDRQLQEHGGQSSKRARSGSLLWSSQLSGSASLLHPGMAPLSLDRQPRSTRTHGLQGQPI